MTDNEDLAKSQDKDSPGIQKYLNNCKSFYSCIHCRAHLADHDDLISRTFHGSHGRAHLFDSAVNVVCGPPVQRHLITGSHLVSDIHCAKCGTTLGWKYEKAYVESQKYKEGKYVIELVHVVRENRHLELDESDVFFGRSPSGHRSSYSNSRSNNSDSSNSPIVSPPTTSKNGSPCSEQDGMMSDARGYDEDLLFTFYDDWCASRSSYPINLSWTHFTRKRRSLYLGSTPYDWKQSSPEDDNLSSDSRYARDDEEFFDCDVSHDTS